MLIYNLNLIVIKKVTGTSKLKKFYKKLESVGMTLAKVKEQDLKK